MPSIIDFLISPLGVLLVITAISIKFTPKSIADNLPLKFVIAFLLWIWYISFAYYTPEAVKALYTDHNFSLQPSFDEPVIFLLIIFAWLIYTFIYYTFIQLQKSSDIIITPGASKPTSCTSANLLKVGDMAFIRTGGTKPIPVEGSTVMFNPLTHIYLIGTHLIFSALSTQNTSIMDVPHEIKRHVRQQRFDLLGVKDCTGGYLTAKELELHKEIPKDKFINFLSDKDLNSKKPLSTIAFLNRITNWNINFDYQLQTREHENKSIRSFFQTHAGISKSVHESEKEGLFDALMGGH